MTHLDLWIAGCGLTALALLQFGSEPLRKAAPFIGLAGQPAWIFVALADSRPGILILAGAYALVYAAGCVRSIKGWRAAR